MQIKFHSRIRETRKSCRQQNGRLKPAGLTDEDVFETTRDNIVSGRIYPDLATQKHVSRLHLSEPACDRSN